MAHNASRKLKHSSSSSGRGGNKSKKELNQELPYYTTSEVASIRRQLKEGNRLVRIAAEGRGYEMDPRIAGRVANR